MMEYSTFARFRDLDMPAFLLTDQMRMPAGMINLSSSIIYGGKLRDGVGTALSDLSKIKDLKTFYAATYPSLQPEPEELIYPVMVNVHGESAREGKSTSVFNAYNVAATLEEIVKLITRRTPRYRRVKLDDLTDDSKEFLQTSASLHHIVPKSACTNELLPKPASNTPAWIFRCC